MRLRILGECVYFGVVLAVFLLLYAGDPFCSEARVVHLVKIAALAAVLTGWDALASRAGIWVRALIAAPWPSRWISAVPASLIVLAGVAAIPSWVYEGYGRFHFANTAADLSCFFKEANYLIFTFLVAPLLAFLSLVREILTQSPNGRANA